jgi:hypothetical protein
MFRGEDSLALWSIECLSCWVLTNYLIKTILYFFLLVKTYLDLRTLSGVMFSLLL